MTSKRGHERDAELDKKIEALRRKNEALMKRYKVRTRAPNQSETRMKKNEGIMRKTRLFRQIEVSLLIACSMKSQQVLCFSV